MIGFVYSRSATATTTRRWQVQLLLTAHELPHGDSLRRLVGGDPTGPAAQPGAAGLLALNRQQWHTFLAAIKQGQFDL